MQNVRVRNEQQKKIQNLDVGTQLKDDPSSAQIYTPLKPILSVHDGSYPYSAFTKYEVHEYPNGKGTFK